MAAASTSACSVAFSPACGGSAVDFCAAVRLTRAPATHLVLTRGTALEIYSLCVSRVPSGTKAPRGAMDGIAGAELELLARVELAGTLQALRALRLPGESHDSLLLSFAPAKLSLVEWDGVSHTLRTRAARSWEGLMDEVGCVDTDAPLTIASDPTASLALLVAHSSFVIALPLPPLARVGSARECVLPGAEEGGGEDEDDAHWWHTWWHVPLANLNLEHCRQLSFLDDSVEPTALLLAGLRPPPYPPPA